jgi:cytochrome oxidase assembly protein ShyY1
VPHGQLSNENSSKTTPKRHRFSVSKIRLPWLIFTLIIFSGLLTLGFWQIERATEKEQRQARIAQLKQQKALSLRQVLSLSEQRNNQSGLSQAMLSQTMLSQTELSQSALYNIDKDYFNDFPLELSGEFNSEQVFLLDNQVHKGKLGYRVLQVASINSYAALVNLGWVAGSINRSILPEVTPLAGRHNFRANMRFVETGIMLMAQDFKGKAWPLRVQQIELDKFSQLINQKLLPFVAYLDKNEQIGFVKNWNPIVMPPEKHRGYAFQWFSLAIAWLSLMLWAAFRAPAVANESATKND